MRSLKALFSLKVAGKKEMKRLVGARKKTAEIKKKNI
jgi:hypothetical protein